MSDATSRTGGSGHRQPDVLRPVDAGDRLASHRRVGGHGLCALSGRVDRVSAAFNKVQSLVAARLIPREMTLDNFTTLFGNPTVPFPRWITNSYKVAIIAALLNVLLAAAGAYAFSRLRFKGRRLGLLTLLLVQVFPSFLGFIALFLLGPAGG